jgi:hypothetical protein
MLASFADDPTGSPLPERKGALCAPADPAFDGKAFNNLMQATQTDVGDWACPVTRDVEVRALPRPNAPVIEKLGMVLHRPAGSVVLVDSVAPIGNDQICCVKDASGWKIGGYIGGGDTQ